MFFFRKQGTDRISLFGTGHGFCGAFVVGKQQGHSFGFLEARMRRIYARLASEINFAKDD